MIQILRKIEFPSSPFRITSQTAQPIRPSKAGSAGTVLLVAPKGLGKNPFFLQICNLYTIQIHISSCSLLLQFARVLIRLWAPVFYCKLIQAFFFIFMWINCHFLVYEMVFVVFKDVMINT